MSTILVGTNLLFEILSTVYDLKPLYNFLYMVAHSNMERHLVDIYLVECFMVLFFNVIFRYIYFT